MANYPCTKNKGFYESNYFWTYFGIFFAMFRNKLSANNSRTTGQPVLCIQKRPGRREKEFDSSSFLTLNVCMFKGRLPSLFGGTTAPVAERAERLARLLEQESPDIFVAQEVPLESGAKIYEAIKDQYPHFWLGIGLIPGEQESDLFVASKYPIISRRSSFHIRTRCSGSIHYLPTSKKCIRRGSSSAVSSAWRQNIIGWSRRIWNREAAKMPARTGPSSSAISRTKWTRLPQLPASPTSWPATSIYENGRT